MKTRKTSQTRATNRPERIPVSGNRDILTVKNQDPAFVYRWVNDIDDRIERFKLGGWEHVENMEVGQRTADRTTEVKGIVSKHVGAGRTSYLMRIKREWYEEDQTAKENTLKDREEAMLQHDKNAEGRYGKVSI